MTDLKKTLFKQMPWMRQASRDMDALRATIDEKDRELDNLKASLAQASNRASLVRSPALVPEQDGELTDRLLSHSVSNPFPDIQLGSHPSERKPESIANASRLLRAYELAMQHQSQSDQLPKEPDGTMWDEITRTGLSDLVAVLDQGDAKALAEFLADFGKAFVWFGGVTTSIDGYNRNLTESHVALTYWDSLIRVAEYLGLIALENPETGPWGKALHHDVDEIVSRIEAHLGISILPPLGIIHTDGLKARNGLLHYRHINSLYAAIRCAELAQFCGGGSRTLEIGGGIGLVALYARRLGIENYTIVDIPITNLLCGNFLLNALGSEAVTLYGESGREKAVNILPYWTVAEMKENEVNLCLNQDSLNELGNSTRSFYQCQIARVTSDLFLSLNHEYFFPKTVRKLVAENSAYRMVSRGPYWPRAGYVEELFDVRGSR